MLSKKILISYSVIIDMVKIVGMKFVEIFHGNFFINIRIL